MFIVVYHPLIHYNLVPTVGVHVIKLNMNKTERKVLKRIKDKDEDNYLVGHDILFISQSRKTLILRKMC